MTDVPTFRPTNANPLPSYVRAGEDLLWQGRPTLLLIFSQALGLLGSFLFLGIFLIDVVARGGSPALALLPLVFVVFFVLLIVLQAIRLRRTEYTVTRQGIYTRTGIIGQTVIQTTFDKITDISLKQDVLGRILGFSALHINTAGSGTPPVRMDGLRDALQMKSLIEEAREAFLKRGDRGAGPPVPPGPVKPVPRFVPASQLVTVRCPTTKRDFRRPRTEVGAKAPCPHCGKQHIVKEAGRARTRPA